MSGTDGTNGPAPENKYDDPLFFEKYGQMERSRKGLAGAGEWHALRGLLPDLRGMRVLDVGCGYGWHCRYAAERGAASVEGVDVSEKMLERARAINSGDAIRYRLLAMEDLDYPAGSFDLVLSSLAFHYLADWSSMCRRIRDMLVPGGWFVFSVEHPVFTAEGRQEWRLDADGAARHWPVDRYFDEGARDAVFLGESVRKHHRSLSGYLAPLLAAGFSLKSVVEPTPEPAMLEEHPELSDEFRRPMMLLLAARTTLNQ